MSNWVKITGWIQLKGEKFRNEPELGIDMEPWGEDTHVWKLVKILARHKGFHLGVGWTQGSTVENEEHAERKDPNSGDGKELERWEKKILEKYGCVMIWTSKIPIYIRFLKLALVITFCFSKYDTVLKQNHMGPKDLLSFICLHVQELDGTDPDIDLCFSNKHNPISYWDLWAFFWDAPDYSSEFFFHFNPLLLVPLLPLDLTDVFRSPMFFSQHHCIWELQNSPQVFLCLFIWCSSLPIFNCSPALGEICNFPDGLESDLRAHLQVSTLLPWSLEMLQLSET